MPTKTVKLLLTENVDNLGIVGDVVSVRLGFARNYLLPRELATTPSEELVASLAAKRAEAQKQVALVRKQREAMIGKMAGVELTLEKPCNDQGILYGAISQNDLAEALKKLGYEVRAREIRIGQTIKRIDSYDIHVKLASDLETTIRLHVKADRHIEEDAREEMEFDNEGNLIEKGRAPRGGRGRRQEAAEAAEASADAAPAEAEPARKVWGKAPSAPGDAAPASDKAEKKAKKSKND